MTLPKVDLSKIKPGDYVFAAKHADASPRDPWRVDFVNHTQTDTCGRASVHFKETGQRPFRYAIKVSARRGAEIIAARNYID